MEPKKKSNVNLDKKRVLFFEFGLIFVLFMTLVAFEWKILPSENDFITSDNTFITPDEIMPITKDEPVKPKVKPPVPLQAEIIKIVDNDAKIKTEFTVASTEATDSTAIVFTASPDIEDTSIYKDWEVDIKPQFPGGDEALLKWLATEIRYTENAKQEGIEGKVGVTFEIQKDGSIDNIEVVRSLHPDLDRVVINKLKEMPKWKPGFKNGKYVTVKFALPVKFKLN